MDVVLGDRQAGKTTALVRWLLAGSSTHRYPGWSRVIVVGHADMVCWTATHFPDENRVLREKFPPGLGKLVLTPREVLRVAQLAGHELEIAVDDIDSILADHLGIFPARVALTGHRIEIGAAT